jgi:cellobiose-specific phosphotransferase system component IIB
MKNILLIEFIGISAAILVLAITAIIAQQHNYNNSVKLLSELSSIKQYK